MIQSVLQIKKVSLVRKLTLYIHMLHSFLNLILDSFPFLFQEIITSKKQRLVSWSDLPDNLLCLLSIRLNHCDDYLSFKRVCVTWRAAVMELKQCHCSPFLMLPPRKSDGRRWLLSPSEGRHYKLNVPGISTDYVCIGSFFHGWLLMIDTISWVQKSFFFNPSTSARINLLRWNTYASIDPHDINRVVLSSAPTDPNCTVIILYNCFGCFRFCRVGDDGWRMQSKLWGIISISVFKGKVYLLYHKKPDLNFKSTNNITTHLEFEYLEPPHHPSSSRIEGRKLVESGGELLLVEKYLISTGSGPACSHGVFRLDLSTSSWVEMKQIGNRVLFLGPGCSASFSATGLGCRENQIYTIESLHGYTNPTWSVYNMVDGSVKSFLSSHDTVWGNAIWITTRFV